MEDIVSPLSTLQTMTGRCSVMAGSGCKEDHHALETKRSADSPKREEKRVPLATNGTLRPISPAPKKLDATTPSSPELSSGVHPITQEPSARLARAGWVLRTLVLIQFPYLVRDRKYHARTFRRCLIGTEMVDWLLQLGSGQVRIHSRAQAIGMWQALLEEGVISHVTQEYHFKDKYLFYRFREDQEGSGTNPTQEDFQKAQAELPDLLTLLLQLAPDAVFRMILRKSPINRNPDDIEIIYEELLHVKALSHLSNSVKRELASILIFETHPKSGTVLFNQGDEGKSWYIILRGSVNVVIYNKGVVCTLHDGDDFGKLALVNDAPRAATIITRVDNCHFLRVDKDDFNRILRDVEANTVRLKEHGQDVLLLQKIPTDGRPPDGAPSHYKYMVMAGTPQKMLEHLLETRIDTRDTFLDDFLLTHVIFMPSHQLCPELMKHYRIDVSNCRQEKEFIVGSKKRVVHFVHIWATIVRDAFFEDSSVASFLTELQEALHEDCEKYGSLQDEQKMLNRVIDARQRFLKDQDSGTPQRWKFTPGGQIRLMTSNSMQDKDELECRRPIKATDEMIFKVYCADHTYTTLKTPVGATCESIKRSAAEKLGLKNELVLVEVKPTGERIPFKDSDVCIMTGLSVNGRIFISPSEHLDALTPLPEQDGPVEGTGAQLETLSSHDIAYQMTLYEWDLFTCVHEYELIYQVFGRHQFRKVVSNLDVFLRRFNEVQFWVVTEMCLAPTISRRAQLLRKFIKLAAHCREYQNLNAFFAVVMGLSNVAVSKMTQTWERLSNKLRRTFTEFETLIDPSRNHRRYRLCMAKMVPPIIPFMPLLLKDMTFSHEGNKTYLEGLVNFEKMHMIAQTIRSLRLCRSCPLMIDPPPASKVQQEVRGYIRSLQVIDSQKRLTHLAHTVESRRT